ncbi:bifunctional SulP family inorganic anion transporter/carbonic anhydrase [Sandaracinus amylolyticus]|uniref:bifunctional SulP family inorganic anion transporter/carbonic anhydrase n=1 Tax=Sandaracinus amylolyticus TaxID=927083 RepID=UPI001EEE572F|nr:SulP family inorganic anion transporter [Sandaracinus amylolyticus]
MASERTLGLLRPRPDLGVRALSSEWRALFARKGLTEDLEQGLLLAAQTLPLAMLIATFSGATAWSGIVSAAVGSAFAVALGGTRSAVSGPGLASSLVVSSIAARHGLGELGIAMVIAGALQVVMGALGIGRFVRLVPLAVIRGALIGIGAAILLAQLPHMIGASVDPDASSLARLDHMGAHLPRTSGAVLVITLASALLGLTTFVHRRIPGPLLAIVLSALAVAILDLDVPRVAESAHLPAPHVPQFPSTRIAQLAGSAFALWITATLCTAVSTAALERVDRHAADPDQELIANGLATVVLAFLGGLPATQLVARSAIAVRLGVTRRRASLVQALVVLVVGLVAWPVMRFVPTAALTGIALAVALPLLDPRPLRDIGRVSRFEGALGVTTAIVIAFAGLVAGVQAGVAIALVAATLRMARTRALVHRSRDPEVPHQVSFSGPLTFLAALELARLRAELAKLPASNGVLIDLRSVVAIDGTGADALIATLDDVHARGGRVALLGPSMVVRERLSAAAALTGRRANEGERADVDAAIAPTERDVDAILGKARSFLARPHLIAGVERFREEMKPHYDSLFAHLADGQAPHTMFVTCADSRVSPGLLMNAHPGDLFIVRCIGALVPPATSEAMPQEGAAVEYGVGVLGVRHIVVCGHSKCGAVSALKKGKVPPELETLGRWAKHATQVAGDLSTFTDADEAAREVAVRQLEHLMTYPLVRERVAKGELQLHAWFYDLGAVELFEWDPKRAHYHVLGAERAPSLTPPPARTNDAELTLPGPAPVPPEAS